VWAAESNGFTFTVLEREGERFKALFQVAKQVREVRGTIRNGRLRWLARDVKAIAGKPGHDNEGQIKGDLIAMTWSEPGGPILGHYNLRLKEPALARPAGTGAGRTPSGAVDRTEKARTKKGSKNR
jgi:hypothetical protein